MSPPMTTLLQHSTYGHLLPEAHGLLAAHADKTKAHLIATGAVMETLAKNYDGDSETWKVAGMLADSRAHYAEKYGAEHPLDSMLRKCLYCADELTGFIIAVALVRPSKKLADVEVKSVLKKFKEKSFAAQVNREQIRKCEELLGISLSDFIGLTLEAMKGVAHEIGL